MDTSDKNIFAERLFYARATLRNMTQSQLAEIAKIPSTSISHFEKKDGARKPSFDNLRRLAKALDVTTDFLLGRTDNPIGTVDEADQLYRDVKMLSEEDKIFAQEMIKKMAERNQEKNK
ncbi:TPA: helix-turn-helix transcriptional regulator [Legionella pneumophila]|nr:helix-turn-helix transcriptional regulator [Legionella pneumophila]HAU1546688.1 helix-turn-helix transcriptional regulator [Legionella pneumophila]